MWTVVGEGCRETVLPILGKAMGLVRVVVSEFTQVDAGIILFDVSCLLMPPIPPGWLPMRSHACFVSHLSSLSRLARCFFLFESLWCLNEVAKVSSELSERVARPGKLIEQVYIVGYRVFYCTWFCSRLYIIYKTR